MKKKTRKVKKLKVKVSTKSDKNVEKQLAFCLNIVYNEMRN